MPEKSFLATVKDELSEAFAAQFDELSDVTTDAEKLGQSMKDLHKAVWTIVERRLKESFKNGQRAKDDGKSRDTVATDFKAPSNPFRR